MTRTYYYMAGLPRSGSSLLSALLNQNPNIYSGPSSPVLPLMITIKEHLNVNELFIGYPKHQQADNIITNIIHQYYSDIEKPIVIDKNRGWTKFVEFNESYFQTKAKILCPVRDVKDILASFVSLIKRNPFQEGYDRINFLDEQLVKSGIAINDVTRCQYLMSNSGVVGQSMNSIKSAITKNLGNRIHYIEYDDLMTNPQSTMNSVYEFLEQPTYQHDFENIELPYKENDLVTYGIPNMHKVISKLQKSSTVAEDILPPIVIQNCEDVEFWRRALM